MNNPSFSFALGLIFFTSYSSTMPATGTLTLKLDPIRKTAIDELMMQEKGRLEAGHNALLDVLEARFGAVPEAIAKRIRSLTEESTLRKANRLAATAASLEEFLSKV